MSEAARALYVRSDEVNGLLSPAEYVEAVREGYRDRGNGAPAEPRTALFGGDPPGMLTGYLAILPTVGAMGGYTYAAGFGNGDAHFLLPLFDADSGDPIALFDGASLNPFKTGATGAVAVDELARDDASEIAVFGSGAQARGQLKTTATVRNLDAVRVFSPTADHRESFASELDEYLDASVSAVDEPAAAIAGADVIITATNASEPVFDGDLLEDGTHVTAMGQYHPERREIDARTVERATYVPDLRDRIDQDAGAFIQARQEGVITDDHVHAELGDVVAGNAPGRTSVDEITLFDSGGTAIETVAAGYHLYQRAREEGLGEEIEIAHGSDALTGK